jgi:hypothetical protein
MEDIFNYITYLTKYFNLLIETEEAAELMKQEIKTKTFQRDRCFYLRKECVKVYNDLFQTFDNNLNELGNQVSIEISKRDTKGQELFYAQLFDIINQFADKSNNINKGSGFSEELIGTKFSKVNIEREDGLQEEKNIEYSFSIAMLADDLSDKFNRLQTLINERFNFLKSKKDTLQKENGNEKLNGRSVALFCSIMNASGLVPKGMDSNQIFCTKICTSFNINAPIKTRQYFRETMELRKSDKYLKEVREKILPQIPLEVREKITAHINDKLTAQDNRKLYA